MCTYKILGCRCCHQLPRYFYDHYGDVIMGAMASQITSLTIVYSTLYSGADQRKHQSSASLAFVRGIHRSPVNSPHKRPVTNRMDVPSNFWYKTHQNPSCVLYHRFDGMSFQGRQMEDIASQTPQTLLFVQHLVQDDIGKSKALHNWPLDM